MLIGQSPSLTMQIGLMQGRFSHHAFQVEGLFQWPQAVPTLDHARRHGHVGSLIEPRQILDQTTLDP